MDGVMDLKQPQAGQNLSVGQRLAIGRADEEAERDARAAEKFAARLALDVPGRAELNQPGFAPVPPPRAARLPQVYRLADALGERGFEAALPLPQADPATVKSLVGPITTQLVEDLRDHPDAIRCVETNALCTKARDGLRALEARLAAAKTEREAAFLRVDRDLGDRLETLDREIWQLEGDLPSATARLATFQRMSSSAGANFTRLAEANATAAGFAGRMAMIGEANELLRKLLAMPAVHDLLARLAALHTAAHQLELHRHMNGIEEALRAPTPAGEPAAAAS